jgi:transposase
VTHCLTLPETLNDRLRQIIKERQRHCFGRKAETTPEDQTLPVLRRRTGRGGQAAETDGSSPKDRQVRDHKRRINRGAVPRHLPRD